MKKRPQNEFSAFNLIIGLLLGFLLGSSVVYWHSNRQNDRLFTEAIDKVASMFKAHAIQLETGDSIILVHENNTPAPASSGQPSILSQARSLSHQFLIEQDKLLHTKIITIKNFKDPVSSTSRKLDSLLGNGSQQQLDHYFFIEFWESPLNSVGYKMGKNKIMLYGIRSYDMVGLAKHKDKVYLKYLNEYYPIEITTSFKPLIPSKESFFSQEIHQF
jgi:hypothetical protein